MPGERGRRGGRSESQLPEYFWIIKPEREGYNEEARECVESEEKRALSKECVCVCACPLMCYRRDWCEGVTVRVGKGTSPEAASRRVARARWGY